MHNQDLPKKNLLDEIFPELKSFPPVIAIMGPTASGKSGVAFELARALGAEIICVDAVTIYKRLNIGSAKPSDAERFEIRHHLLDCAEPWKIYTANDFLKDTWAVMLDRLKAGKPLLLVGGTFLYFKGLIEGFSELPEASEKFRKILVEKMSQYGLEHLYNELQKCDPIRASQVHSNDTHRILRALEVFHLSKVPMSAQLQNRKSHLTLKNYPNFHAFSLGPQTSEELKKRIEDRFHLMIKQGFLEEVNDLFQDERLNDRLPSIRSLGYRQLWQYCLGFEKKEEAFNKAIVATKAFAKRQQTWLRHWPYCHQHFYIDTSEKISQKILQKIAYKEYVK